MALLGAAAADPILVVAVLKRFQGLVYNHLFYHILY
jgi:hypothetical protein